MKVKYTGTAFPERTGKIFEVTAKTMYGHLVLKAPNESVLLEDGGAWGFSFLAKPNEVEEVTD